MNRVTIISTDPIADMLTRIRNAAAVNKQTVELPYSKIKETVAKILAGNGFLAAVTSEGKGKEKMLVITVSGENQPTQFTSISRISRPGRRVYVGADDIPTVKRGRGIVIISTSKGVMAGKDAQKQRLGGELICEVY